MLFGALMLPDAGFAQGLGFAPMVLPDIEPPAMEPPDIAVVFVQFFAVMPPDIAPPDIAPLDIVPLELVVEPLIAPPEEVCAKACVPISIAAAAPAKRIRDIIPPKNGARPRDEKPSRAGAPQLPKARSVVIRTRNGVRYAVFAIMSFCCVAPEIGQRSARIPTMDR